MSDNKYAILRVKKIKNAGNLAHSLRHSFRERETINADMERTPENSHFGAESTEQALAKFRERLPQKIRSNAVVALEYLITGSPETMGRKPRQHQDYYFANSLKWLKDKHGAENVFYAGIHRDETNPHMYAYVVPNITKEVRGKRQTVLCARDYVGGKQKLSDMQTDFVEKVGKRHGFERGRMWSGAKHLTMQEIYYSRYVSRVEAQRPDISYKDMLPEKKRGVSKEDYAKEAMVNLMDTISPYLQYMSQKADKAGLTNKQMKELVRQLDRAMNSVAKLKDNNQALEKDVARLDKNQRTFADVIASRDPKKIDDILDRMKGREHHFLSQNMFDQLFPERGSAKIQKEVDRIRNERSRNRDYDTGMGW